MGGKWDASTTNIDNSISPVKLLRDMVIGGTKYIQSCKFWPLVFLKVSSAIIFGASDVLNVSFSEEAHDGSNEAENSRRLGVLFCCVGIGCFIGPLISDRYTSMKNMYSILNGCIISYAIQGLGWLGIGYIAPFPFIGLFTAVRSVGSSVNWIYSTLLLQVSTIFTISRY